MLRRVRRHCRDARRARDQARGESRASAEPRRALRARAVGASGAVQSRPVSRPDGSGAMAASCDITWDEALQLFRQRVDEARASGRGGRARCSSTSTRAGSFPASSISGSRAIGTARRTSRRSDARSRRDRGQPSGVRRRVAVASISPPRGSSSRSAPTSSTAGARASRSSSTSPTRARSCRARRASSTSARAARSPA